MSRAAVFKQADVERAVRGAVRGAGLQPGTFTIKISPTGDVAILPFAANEPNPDDPDAEMKAWMAKHGNG